MTVWSGLMPWPQRQPGCGLARAPVQEKEMAVEAVRKVDGEVYLEQAYGARSSGNAHRWVRTWHE